MKIAKKLAAAVRFFAPEARVDQSSFHYRLTRRAVESSVEFVEKHMLYAEPFPVRRELYRYCMDRMPKDGLILEFGVHDGDSINEIAALTDRKVYGFDSFIGLPDDGLIPKNTAGASTIKAERPKWFAGKLDLKGEMPKVRDNVALIKGWFDPELTRFYRDHNSPVALMHIDSDIYSSAKFVLTTSRDRIKKGTIIIFDDFFNYEGWQRNEHRALMEFASEANLKYEFIAYNYTCAAAIRVL